MPKFDTPASISVVLEFGIGNVRLVASDRTDTVVEVRPSNSSDESDVEAAGQLRVDHSDGTLRITGPKRMFDFSKKSRSVGVSIELPSGSGVTAHLTMGEIHGTGPLGECRLKTTGHVRLDRTGPLQLHTGMGNVAAGRIDGDADLSTATGKIEVGEVRGSAQVKNSNGDTTIDQVTGDVRVRNANGDIAVERAGAGVDVKTANGIVRLGEVVRGSIVADTANGDLSIGIAEGTAAWLEVTTGFGRVDNRLANALGPDEAEQTVEVRGRTGYGDITILRS